tara:strand:- start:290 stop:493 length:204 start_codon:yes stop_codon:yes gene_type:complete
MRTYYCTCGDKVECASDKLPKCSCGKVFGVSSKVSDHINMRTTWSGQTKIEFSQTTVDKDVASWGKR